MSAAGSVLNVRAYDTGAGYSIPLRAGANAGDICHELAHQMSLTSQDAKFYSLIFVTTIFSSMKKCYIHYLRSLTARDIVMNVQSTTIAAIMAMKYRKPGDQRKLEESASWFYKDIRSTPITFNDGGEICAPPEFMEKSRFANGHHDHDPAAAVEMTDGSDRVLIVHHREEGEEEEPLSSSDLTYLAKAERKGYLLKRSSRDHHLWKRWYCVLMDHLWCVDISSDYPKAIKVKLSGGVRYKDPHSMDGIRTILISTNNRTHYFRCLNTQDQHRWIEELNIRSSLAVDNNLFGMAEIIMNDEECAKSQRLHTQVQDVLDTSSAYAVLVLQEDYLSALSSSKDSPRKRGVSDEDGEMDRDDHDVHSVNGALILESDLQVDTSHIASSCSSMSSKGRRRTLAVAQNKNTNANSESCSSPANNVNGSSDLQSSPFPYRGMQPSMSSDPVLEFNITEQFHRQSFLHYLHEENPTFSDVLSFIIEVQKFKELYRHDIFVADNTQRGAALIIYFTHLLPQVQLMDTTLADSSLKVLATLLRNTTAVHPHVRQKLEKELSSKLRKHRNITSTGAKASSGLSVKSRSEGSIRYAHASSNGHWQDASHYLIDSSVRRLHSSRDILKVTAIQGWGISLTSIRRVFEELFGLYTDVGGSREISERNEGNRSPHNSLKSHDLLQNSYLLEKYGGSFNSASSGSISDHHTGTRPEDVLVAAAAVVSSEKKETVSTSASKSYWPFFSSMNSSGPSTSLSASKGKSEATSRPVSSAHKVTERAPPQEIFDTVVADLMQVLNQ